MVASSCRPNARALYFVVLAAVCPASLGASPQQVDDLPVSLERIREGLAKTPAARLDMPVQVPVAKFKTRVEQRVYVLSLDGWLRREFSLTLLQRQSAEWGSKCCGIDLGSVFKSIDRSLERRKTRKIREQIARELAELEAARNKLGQTNPR